MKHTLIAALAVSLWGAGVLVAGDYSVSPEKSKVTFKIMNKPPGAKEASEVAGKFNEFSGSLSFDKSAPEKSQVELEVRTTSVDTGNAKRDAHLKNQDFFKVKEFPTMSFKSKSVKQGGDGKLEVTGDFTMLGKTKPVTVTFELTGENSGKTIFQIKRSEYGMTYRVPDTADEVDVTMEIIGVAK